MIPFPILELQYIHPKTLIFVEGGAHYSFDKFKKINTMKFLPNTLFAFLKTDLSFHGVEVIQDQQIERDLIIYNVNIKS